MKIYFWGIGKKCNEFLNAKIIDAGKIVGYIETRKSCCEFNSKKVYEPCEIDEYDFIFVTVLRNATIYEICIDIGLDLNKVCFLYPCEKENNKDKNINIVKQVCTNNGYNYICSNYGMHDSSWIIKDAEIYTKMNKRKNFEIHKEENLYISEDKYNNAGNIGSYFWQDLWAAQKIIKDKPQSHYDIGSRIDGFIAHLIAADISVNLIDIRPFNIKIENVDFTCADATNLDGIEDNSVTSISALCSLEHFGLGRYGDPIDSEAPFKCFGAIERKAKSGGNIYISVPIGKEHIEFNAHRVFYATTIIESFPNCDLIEFSSSKNEVFETNIDITKYDKDKTLGGSRFGLFHFRKKQLKL